MMWLLLVGSEGVRRVGGLSVRLRTRSGFTLLKESEHVVQTASDRGLRDQAQGEC